MPGPPVQYLSGIGWADAQGNPTWPPQNEWPDPQETTGGQPIYFNTFYTDEGLTPYQNPASPWYENYSLDPYFGTTISTGPGTPAGPTGPSPSQEMGISKQIYDQISGWIQQYYGHPGTQAQIQQLADWAHDKWVQAGSPAEGSLADLGLLEQGVQSHPVWFEAPEQPAASPPPSGGGGGYHGGGGGGGFHGGGGGGGYHGGGGAILPTVPPTFYEAPDPFEYPDYEPPEWNPPEFEAPEQFSYPEFEAPSSRAVFEQDPGYQFRLDESLRALRNEQSAKGLLKSGASAKSLLDYAQSVADQAYEGVYGRQFNTWAANRQAASQDYNTLWQNLITDYMVDYTQGMDEQQLALQNYQTGLGKAAQEYAFGLDVAAGKAGGLQGATTLAGQLGLGQAGLQLEQSNSMFNNLLSLYLAAAQQQPQYTPYYGPGQTGFQYA